MFCLDLGHCTSHSVEITEIYSAHTHLTNIMWNPEKSMELCYLKCSSNLSQIWLSQIFKEFSRQSFLQKGLAVEGFELGSPWWQSRVLTTILTQRVVELGFKNQVL